MLNALEITSKSLNSKLRTFEVNKPDVCPICHTAGNFEFIDSTHKEYIKRPGDIQYTYFLQAVYQCQLQTCQALFIAYHDGYETALGSPIRIKPVNFVGKNFGDEIKKIEEKLNTSFFNIYRQAEEAESLGLNYICGGGYRKALEHLIKDYAIYISPDDKDKISDPSYRLSQCIKDYLEGNLPIFAKLGSYFGNDEIHYTKIHDQKGIDDLKSMIQMTLTGILYEISSAEGKEYLDKS